MKKFSSVCERLQARRKSCKTSLLADYLRSRSVDEAAVSAVFLSGRPFPMWEEATLQIGGRSLWRIVAELSGNQESDLTAAYRRLGDLGAVAGELLPERPGNGLEILDVEREFRGVAATRGPTEKSRSYVICSLEHVGSRRSTS